MNVLLLGSGGREHALAWKLAQSPRLRTLYASPGNPGIAEHAICVTLDVTDHDAVITFCRTHNIELVIIGPEAPLVDGLGDSLRSYSIAVLGPNKHPAQLEGSKGFTKDLCARANIPTAGYVRAHDPTTAHKALQDFSIPVVIKADGLAAGKGVIIAESLADAEAAIVDMFSGSFGSAGASVVIEEFMTGEEASFFALTDGTNIIALGSAQDHKRVGEGDTGPNTGGMGAYSPAPVLTPALEQKVMDDIIAPTVAHLREAGTPYSGILFAGLMLTDTGPRLIEYNARFGDPECQVLMMRLDGDILPLFMATANGTLGSYDPATLTLKPETALTVVLAAKGYPGTPEKGGAIAGIDAAQDSGAKVFHAGTQITDTNVLIAVGGRVLNVTAMGSSVTQAQSAAYQAVHKINFPTGFCRRDIGWREVEREKSV